MKTLSKEELIAFEEGIAEAAARGEVKGPIRLSYGNEDQLLKIFEGVKEEDWVFSTHRNHYHGLLKGIPPAWLKEEIFAGFSMTISSPKHRFYASAIVGDIAPIAVGTALGLKLKGAAEHVWCFVGDMFAEMGAFEESVKYAERHDLPITFVVEDNGVSVVTPTQETWGLRPRVSKVVRYSYKNARYPHAGVQRKYAGF